MSDSDPRPPFRRLSTREEFDAELPHLSQRSPAHVFLGFPIADRIDLLTSLCQEHKIYSIYVVRPDGAVTDFASRVDWVPVFPVQSSAEAERIAKELVGDPYRVAYRAINGEDVVVNFLSGNPS